MRGRQGVELVDGVDRDEVAQRPIGHRGAVEAEQLAERIVGIDDLPLFIEERERHERAVEDAAVERLLQAHIEDDSGDAGDLLLW